MIQKIVLQSRHCTKARVSIPIYFFQIMEIWIKLDKKDINFEIFCQPISALKRYVFFAKEYAGIYLQISLAEYFTIFFIELGSYFDYLLEKKFLDLSNFCISANLTGLVSYVPTHNMDCTKKNSPKFQKAQKIDLAFSRVGFYLLKVGRD